MASYQETFSGKLDWAMPFQRTGRFPLDRTDLFASLEDAKKYAKGNVEDPDSRGLVGSSYIGQIITVYENDQVSVFKINATKDLEEVGTATAGDGKSIVLSDKILSLYGFDNATEGQQCRVKNIGSPDEPKLVLEWYTPDTSTVDGLRDKVTELEGKVTTINSGSEVPGSIDYKIAENNKNYYDKSTIDGKLTGALHYKGSYNSFTELQAAVTDGSITPNVGDVYNIKTAGGTDKHGIEIKSGDNVICISFTNEPTPTATWDVSSGTIDLSNYYNKSEVDQALGNKVDKVEGSRLITAAEGQKIADSTKVEESETNGNIKIDGSETVVYTAPTATNDSLGDVKGTTDTVDKIKIEADGTMTIYKVSGSKVEGAVAEANKVTNALRIGSKTYDGSAPITVDGSDLNLPENIITEDEIATADNVGVVKSATDTIDKIKVEEDGTMSIYKVSGSKVNGAVAEATKVTNALTFGSKTFDGSSPATVEASDLGAATTADLAKYVKFTDIATSQKTGAVKGTTDTVDKIKIEADGTMSIYKVSGSKVNGAVAEATNASQLGGVNATDILVDSEGLTSKVKSAGIADKLAAQRNIALSGDVTGSATFDGSSDATINATLPDIVTGGTFAKITFNNKGQVTNGEALSAADIPSLTMAKISDAGALAKKNEVSETDLDEPLTEKLNGLSSNSHTHTNKTVLDGISSQKVGDWDQAATDVRNKADKANTLAGYGITDAYTKEQVNGMVGGAFHYKGTYNTFIDLQNAITTGVITEVLVGDVYNIQTAGGTDSHGVQIKAGDNLVVQEVTGESPTFEIEWDVLAGTVDLSNYYNRSEIDSKLEQKAEKTTVETISGKVDTLETTVSDPQTGLVKKVTDNTSNISKNSTAISDLQSTVGKSNTEGLRKQVKDNTDAIATLNGEEETPGSVKQIVAASATEIKNSITQITEEGTGTIDTRINTHNTSPDAHSAEFAKKQNKAIKQQLSMTTDMFTENDAENGPVYKGTIKVPGLSASSNYSPSIAPAITSCKLVQAAQFYPIAEMNGDSLTVYCVNKPSDTIVLEGTFLEII